MMSLYCCGFNGFNQLFTNEAKGGYTFSTCSICDVVDAVFSWSCMYILTRQNVFASGLPCSLMRIKIPKDIEISQISCASRRCHVVLVATNGLCFLYNGGSQAKELPSFTSVEGSDSSQDSKIIQVCCGEVETLAVSNTGVAYSIPSPISLPPRVKATRVACGFEHNLLLTENGTVFSWGIGSRGQLGHGGLDDEEAPRQISALSSIVVTDISAGGWHSAAIDDLGDVWSWGWNNEGQLGFPSTKARKDQMDDDTEKLGIVNISSIPITVPLGFSGKVVQVACGTRHTVALCDDGTLWGCGWNEYGQLAKPPTCMNCYRMTRMEAPAGRITKIFCGSWNTGILLKKP